MNLEQFAKDSGVEVVDCGSGWDGKYGYVVKGSPNSTYCGYRTEKAAYEAWLTNTFGKQAKAIKKLLKHTQSVSKEYV